VKAGKVKGQSQGPKFNEQFGKSKVTPQPCQPFVSRHLSFLKQPYNFNFSHATNNTAKSTRASQQQ
jgi:hypothetical protein